MSCRAWPLAVVFAASTAFAQFQLEDSHTTADLRGIDNVGAGVAWASGTNGTVLRTEDGGYLWQACATPPGAEHLDFRGIQAFDADTAIVMSSGKGNQSRLYKTTDGCQSWKPVFTNPDPDGFWDAIHKTSNGRMYVLGDPVQNIFTMFVSQDRGDTWLAASEPGRDARPGDGAFAASNSEMAGYASYLLFGTGGPSSSRVYVTGLTCSSPPGRPDGPATYNCTGTWKHSDVPIAAGTASSGVFSLAAKEFTTASGILAANVVAVGGSYEHPEDASGTAAYSIDGGLFWFPSQVPPHGYRSAVAYDAAAKTWITVGPNGTDISANDGRIWRALHPNPALHESADADRNWNALSLPYVVGPHGRIGKLDPEALAPPKHP